MMDYMTILLTMIAFIMMILSIEYHESKFWSSIFTILDITLWFFLAATILETETITYTFNITTNILKPDIYIYTSKTSIQLLYLYYLMGIIMTIYFIAYHLLAPLIKLIKK